MKAPNKIYLEPYLDNPDKLHSSWYCHDIIGSGIEYVRKDALLEWLKKEIAFYPDEIYSNDHYEDGAKEALQGVIDKLNSM